MATSAARSWLEELFAAQLGDLGIVFQREVRFHPVRKWRFDFVLIVGYDKVAVEINGAIYRRGRHSRGSGLEGDYEKLNEAQMMGYKVFQFSSNQVQNLDAINFIKRILERNVECYPTP